MKRIASTHLGLITGLLVGLFLVCAPAQAQWKWRSGDGQITVSDLPPPFGTPDADILQRPDPATLAAPAAAPASGPSATVPKPPTVDSELQARKQAADQEQAAKAKAKSDAEAARLAEQRRQNCQSARSQLAALDSGQRMARVNAQGEREIMDDRMRAESSRRAREVIASDCR